MLKIQLSGFSNITSDEVVVGGYECIVVVCIYNDSPITADTMPDAEETFTACVDPVSAPLFLAFRWIFHALPQDDQN